MKKLGFRKLQFGDAPIRIEAVRMNRERKEGVFLEMDFRWAGDPDIQLFVDAIGGCDPVPACAPCLIHHQAACKPVLHLHQKNAPILDRDDQGDMAGSDVSFSPVECC